MSSGRYVPPHLRGKARQPELPPQNRAGGFQQPNSFDGGIQQNSTFDGNRQSNRGPDGGNRFFGGDRNRGGFRGGRGGGFGGGGGRGRGGRSFPSGGGYSQSKTALGFHGSEDENQRLEEELFGGAHVTQGINFDKYDDIPAETSGRDCPDPLNEFNEELLGEKLMDNIARAHFSRPTPVQKYSIPIGYVGRDLMACAQTGSGKTGGFLFPIIGQMLRNGAVPLPSNASRGRAYPNALILSPTRELATQIYEESRKFVYRTGIRNVVVYGGADMRYQLQQLGRGCDVLVATPGRLIDLIERGRISLACVAHLILDEADRMLDMGFEPQIRRIVQEEDMTTERQTFMFSATFPKEIQRLASDFMRDYIFLAIGRVGSAAADITQKLEYVEENEKPMVLMRHLNNITDGLILVFVETKRVADMLENGLCREGFPATSIHGDRTQREREAALSSFKSGRTPILVATDVASRGLDINNVTHVFNYDMPSNTDDYVHRIGRTGRAGNTGLAVAFMNEGNINVARDIYNLMQENGQEVPSWLVTMGRSRGFGGGGRGRGRGGGGGRFGGRDFRREYSGGGRGGGSRGGGGRGRGGGRGGGGGGRFSRQMDSADNSAW